MASNVCPQKGEKEFEAIGSSVNIGRGREVEVDLN